MRVQLVVDKKKNLVKKKFDLADKKTKMHEPVKQILAEVERYQCSFCKRKFN